MRVDKFLSIVGLIPRGRLKKEGVELKINGKKAKPSKEIKVGDIISVSSPTLYFEIEVLKLPVSKSVKKTERNEYYNLIVFKKQKKQVNSEFIKWLLED